VVDIVLEHGPPRGLFLSTKASSNNPKSTIWCPSAATSGQLGEDPLDRGVPLIKEPGVVLLGSPIGSVQYERSALQTRVDKVKEILDRLPLMEDPHSEYVLHQVLTSTPNQPQQAAYTLHNQPSIPPPSYSSTNYWTPPPGQVKPFNQNYHLHDSGFYGSVDSPNKSYSYQSSNSVSPKSTLWSSISSPVSSIKNKLTGRGRSTFFDDEQSRRWKINPQQILGCLLFLTLFSSLGFAFLISVKHFGSEDGQAASVNGKYQSMKFAKEQSYDDAVADKGAVESNVIKEDPVFGFMNEIGEMTDNELEKKLKSVVLDPKVKVSTIGRVDIETSVNAIEDGQVLSVELLTHRPFVVEHPAPTQAPVDKSREISSKLKLKTTETQLKEDLPKEILTFSNDSEEETFSAKVTSKSRRKSKHINPLTKNSKEDKMSRAKIVRKITDDLSDSKSLDYPDLPTFRRGFQPTEQKENDEEDGVNVDTDSVV